MSAIHNPRPTAESLLSKLVELYADQMGVKVEYTITDEGNERNVQHTG